MNPLKHRLQSLWQGQVSLKNVFWAYWPGLSFSITSLISAGYGLYFLIDSFKRAGVGGFFLALITPLVFLQMTVILLIPSLALAAMFLFVPLIRSARRYQGPRLYSVAAIFIFSLLIVAGIGLLIYKQAVD